MNKFNLWEIKITFELIERDLGLKKLHDLRILPTIIARNIGHHECIKDFCKKLVFIDTISRMNYLNITFESAVKKLTLLTL